MLCSIADLGLLRNGRGAAKDAELTASHSQAKCNCTLLLDFVWSCNGGRKTEHLCKAVEAKSQVVAPPGGKRLASHAAKPCGAFPVARPEFGMMLMSGPRIDRKLESEEEELISMPTSSDV